MNIEYKNRQRKPHERKKEKIIEDIHRGLSKILNTHTLHITLHYTSH